VSTPVPESESETGTLVESQEPTVITEEAAPPIALEEEAPPPPPSTEGPTPYAPEAENYYTVGVNLFQEGRYAEAIAAFENDITSSYLFLARCYQILGEDEEALKRYQRILWEYPDRSAFVEVFSLAEEMFAAGDYPSARKLFYAFIAQAGRMPGKVKNMVARAYFRIGRCLEEETLALLKGRPPAVPLVERGAPYPVIQEKTERKGTETSPPETRPLNAREAWTPPPARITVDSKRESDFYTAFTLECVCAPALSVIQTLAGEAGCELNLNEHTRGDLAQEVISASLKDQALDVILEYVTGQIGMTYTLDGSILTVTGLMERVAGDWRLMKEEAEKVFQRSIGRFIGHEDTPKVYFEISRLHYLTGDFKSAVEPGRTLITDYPEFSQLPEALYYTSECYWKLGDYGKAKDYLRELINKYTHHPIAQDGYLLLARSQWLDGNPAAAQMTLRSLADRFPDSPLRYEGQATLARIMISLDNFATAREILEAIPLHEVEKQDAAAEILLLKAEAQLRMGDAESAVTSAILMLENHPGHEEEQEALFLLAEGYAEAAQPFWAFAICKTLKEKFPETATTPFLYTTAGRALRALGFHHRALEWMDEGLSQCVEGTEDTFEMYMLLGEILFDMEKYERAKTVFKKTSESSLYEEKANQRYVQAQMKQEDFRGALHTLGLLLREENQTPSCRSRLFKMAAECFEALGEMNGAIAAYEGRWPDVDLEGQKNDD
jgi:TolA-binding protein